MRKLFKNIFTEDNCLYYSLIIANITIALLCLKIIKNETIFFLKSLHIVIAILSCINVVILVYKDINRNKK